jgi:hypothetical protein
MGISETINKQKMITKPKTTTTLSVELDAAQGKTTGIEGINEAQNNPLAGTGKPKKEVVCRVSILNFANRKAVKTGKRNATKGKPENQVASCEICVK